MRTEANSLGNVRLKSQNKDIFNGFDTIIPVLKIGGWSTYDVGYGHQKYKHKGFDVIFKGFRTQAFMNITIWPASYDIGLTVSYKNKEKTVILYRHTDIAEPSSLSNEEIIDIAKKVGTDLLEELVKLSLTEDLERRYPWIHDPDFMK